jgi:hypothetical protein
MKTAVYYAGGPLHGSVENFPSMPPSQQRTWHTQTCQESYYVLHLLALPGGRSVLAYVAQTMSLEQAKHALAECTRQPRA